MTGQSRQPGEILSRLLTEHTGQTLGEGRMWRIDTELAPVLRDNGLQGLDQLVDALDGGRNQPLLDACLDALLNHETSFFRDLAFFQCLRADILPALRAGRPDKTLRIWSVGCATGQEPYSLAMMIASEPDVWAGWKIRIMATDVSAIAVEKARRGLFEQRDVQRGLAINDLLKWFEPHEGAWKISDALRSMIEFRQHNVADGVAPINDVDLILCRNVLLYLPLHTKDRVCALFERVGREGCHILLGAGETLATMCTRMQRCDQTRLSYRLGGEPPGRWRDGLRKAG